MPVIKPPRLRKGDLIGLVAPAGAPRPLEKIEQSVKYLEALGYRTLLGRHAANEHGFLAGTDAERAADLNAMIRDRRVKAIFALRGGYGCSRILDQIDYDALRRAPKIISGFSDLTALQLAIYQRCKLVTFSGPMPAVEFWQNPDPYTEENFWRLLTTAKRPGPLVNPPEAPLRCVRPGKTSGILLGGNLALVVSILGTPYSPSYRNAILVMEDVDEAPYRIDRMLTQLRNARPAIKGVIYGNFTRCEPTTPNSFPVNHVLQDFANLMNLPALADLQYGHVPKKLTVPFGVRARMDADCQTIELFEAAVK